MHTSSAAQLACLQGRFKTGPGINHQGYGGRRAQTRMITPHHCSPSVRYLISFEDNPSHRATVTTCMRVWQARHRSHNCLTLYAATLSRPGGIWSLTEPLMARYLSADWELSGHYMATVPAGALDCWACISLHAWIYQVHMVGQQLLEDFCTHRQTVSPQQPRGSHLVLHQRVQDTPFVEQAPSA